MWEEQVTYDKEGFQSQEKNCVENFEPEDICKKQNRVICIV